ncbi:MAG TPA: YihY/virulence factor BrkB family protein [Candidatus Limnocylindrales bacterium]|nr:YihY/virulence factor BrkB family protein [Candidatus Limnocylindrales bacterium]
MGRPSRHPVVELAVRLVRHVGRDDVGGLAAELAFRFFLALFPFAIFLATLGALAAVALGVPNPAETIAAAASGLLPGEAAELIEAELRGIVARADPRILSFGAIAALWVATGGTNAVIKAMNRAYGVVETRPLWARYALAVGLTLLAGAAIVLSFVVVLAGQVAGSALAARLGLDPLWAVLLPVLRWPLSLALLIVAATVLYRVAPNVEVPLRSALPGAIAFSVGWLVATYLFGVYVSEVATYGATYGALAGVAILLVWLYLTGFVLLLGAELNEVLAGLLDPAAHAARRRATNRGRARATRAPSGGEGETATNAGVTSERPADRTAADRTPADGVAADPAAADRTAPVPPPPGPAHDGVPGVRTAAGRTAPVPPAPDRRVSED